MRKTPNKKLSLPIPHLHTRHSYIIITIIFTLLWFFTSGPSMVGDPTRHTCHTIILSPYRNSFDSLTLQNPLSHQNSHLLLMLQLHYLSLVSVSCLLSLLWIHKLQVLSHKQVLSSSRHREKGFSYARFCHEPTNRDVLTTTG
mgnify:FL=1